VSNTLRLYARFPACPLCDGNSLADLRVDRCNGHPLWQRGLSEYIHWVHCTHCEHVFSRDFFTPEGLALLFGRANPSQIATLNIDIERTRWAPSIERVQQHLGQPAWAVDDAVWLDVGCGGGGLVITAAEYGFTAIGLDTRFAAVEHLRKLGYSAEVGDLSNLDVSDPVQVISLADVLEHVPYPRNALKRVYCALQPHGLVMISCPNLDCGSWRKSNADGVNPYWGEIEHHHNFSRASLMRLLAEEGFQPLSYHISVRYKSCMEIIARRTA